MREVTYQRGGLPTEGLSSPQHLSHAIPCHATAPRGTRSCQSLGLFSLLYPVAYLSLANWRGNLQRVTGFLWTQALKLVPSEQLSHSQFFHIQDSPCFAVPLSTHWLLPYWLTLNKSQLAALPKERPALEEHILGKQGLDLFAATPNLHPAQQNTTIINNKGRDESLLAMQSNGQHTQQRPSFWQTWSTSLISNFWPCKNLSPPATAVSALLKYKVSKCHQFTPPSKGPAGRHILRNMHR